MYMSNGVGTKRIRGIWHGQKTGRHAAKRARLSARPLRQKDPLRIEVGSLCPAPKTGDA